MHISKKDIPILQNQSIFFFNTFCIDFRHMQENMQSVVRDISSVCCSWKQQTGKWDNSKNKQIKEHGIYKLKKKN